MSSSRPVIRENLKRGTKRPEIVKMKKNQSFYDFFDIFGEKYFSKKMGLWAK